jgi:hypothetical protein
MVKMATAFNSLTPKYDPNPGFGKVPLLDILRAVGSFGRVALETLVFLLGGAGKTQSKPLKTRLQIFFLRRCVHSAPRAQY